MPREPLDTGTDTRFMRREADGRFGEMADVGRSLAQDRARKAKRVVRSGEGDRGDQKPRAAKAATKRRATAATKRTSSAATGRTGAKARPRAKAKATGAGRSRGTARGR